MNRDQFLNKEIINKDNQRGTVISFDENHLVVRYENEQKIYYPDIAFKSKYLSFLDSNLNILIDEDLSIKEQEEYVREQTIIRNHNIAVERNKRVNEYYAKLSAKNSFLQKLFGCDFQYPPLVKFKKQYRHLIRNRRGSGIIAMTYGK